MKKPIVFHGIIEKEGNQFSAICLEMEVASCGDTMEEARANLKEAVEGFIEIGLEEGDLEEFGFRNSDFGIKKTNSEFVILTQITRLPVRTSTCAEHADRRRQVTRNSNNSYHGRI